MPNVELTEMDLAVIECLHSLGAADGRGPQANDLVTCLRRQFPENDEVAMREGESITRLRGRQLLEVGEGGRISLTSLGVEMAEGLLLEGSEGTSSGPQA